MVLVSLIIIRYCKIGDIIFLCMCFSGVVQGKLLGSALNVVFSNVVAKRHRGEMGLTGN